MVQECSIVTNGVLLELHTDRRYAIFKFKGAELKEVKTGWIEDISMYQANSGKVYCDLGKLINGQFDMIVYEPRKEDTI